jgi:hypothetical protein
MNPVAPVTSAVFFEPGFTYLTLAGAGGIAESRARALALRKVHFSRNTRSIYYGFT